MFISKELTKMRNWEECGLTGAQCSGSLQSNKVKQWTSLKLNLDHEKTKSITFPL